MDKLLTLSPKEISQHNWHVQGTRRYDALIKIFMGAKQPLNIGVHEAREVVRMQNLLPMHRVQHVVDFKDDADIFIVPVCTQKQAKFYHENMPAGKYLYTLWVGEPKTAERLTGVDTLHVCDGTLLGITRMQEVTV